MACRSVFNGQAPLFQFPDDAGTEGEFLRSDGSGATSWADPSQKDLDGHTVEQQTNSSTPVTLNTEYGVITTQNITAPANNAQAFLLNNDKIEPNTQVKVWIQDYSGLYVTQGSPVVVVKNKTAGSIEILVLNCSSTSAMNGIVDIYFELVQLDA